MIKFFHGWNKMPTLRQQREEELAKAKQEQFELTIQLEAITYGLTMREARIARLERELQNDNAE